MNIGIFDYALDFSVRIYIDNMVRELAQLGVRFQPFGHEGGIPEDVDLYWDPRLTGGTPPWHRLRPYTKPIVATVYDAAPLGLPPWEYYSDFRSAYRGLRGMAKRIYEWKRAWRKRCTIITISEFSRTELRRKLFLYGEKIIPVRLGVNHDLFRPGTGGQSENYLLHVSQYQPKKNVDRIFTAYQKLDMKDKPPLIAVLTRFDKPDPGHGIQVIRDPVSDEELVRLYQNATGFLFPSLHEGFGLPIIEAMACGCPVITSNVTACTETAGDAALKVNPRSVSDLAGAMRQIIEDPDLRADLRARGLEHARSFTWRTCAEGHLKVFTDVVDSHERSLTGS